MLALTCIPRPIYNEIPEKPFQEQNVSTRVYLRVSGKIPALRRCWDVCWRAGDGWSVSRLSSVISMVRLFPTVFVLKNLLCNFDGHLFDACSQWPTTSYVVFFCRAHQLFFVFAITAAVRHCRQTIASTQIQYVSFFLYCFSFLLSFLFAFTIHTMYKTISLWLLSRFTFAFSASLQPWKNLLLLTFMPSNISNVSASYLSFVRTRSRQRRTAVHSTSSTPTT